MKLSRTPRWLALGLALALSACSHDFQLMKMEEQLNRYGGFIRWSMFKRSLEFHAMPPSPPPDWQALGEVKVTYYQPLFRDVLMDGTLVQQSVDIRYVTGNSVVERGLMDEQRWRFDEGKDRWVLETGMPRFVLNRQ